MDEIQMPVARAAVELIGADRGAHQLLEEIQLFVAAAGGDKPRDGVRSIFGFDIGQATNRRLDRFDPRGLRQLPALPDQWLREACLAVDELKPEPPAYAETAVALSRLRPVAPFILPGQRRGHAHD